MSRRGTVIPSDDQLRRMSQKELNKLANELKDQCYASGDYRALEWLSDALLRIHQAWLDGAHSETTDTRRRRRICGREIPIGGNIDYIPTPISDSHIRQLMAKACKSGLTRRQQEVWILHDVVGYTQVRIADLLEIGQPAVSRCLTRARNAMWDYIDRNDPAFRVFLMESHRTAYFRPSPRPRLPEFLDAARQKLEEDPATSTHIQTDAWRRVEIWKNLKPILVPDLMTGDLRHYGVTFRSLRPKKLKKFKPGCNKMPKN